MGWFKLHLLTQPFVYMYKVLMCTCRRQSAPAEETTAMGRGVMRPVILVVKTTSPFSSSPNTSNLWS